MAEIKGKGTFGVSSDNNLTQSLSKTKTADTAELRDTNGDVVGLAIYNKRIEISAEVGVSPGTAVPVVGGEFEGGIITSVVENESNSTFKTFSITAVVYSNMGTSN